MAEAKQTYTSFCKTLNLAENFGTDDSYHQYRSVHPRGAVEVTEMQPRVQRTQVALFS